MDEGEQLQQRRNERVKSLPLGTAGIKPPPVLTSSGQPQSILFVHGVKSITSPVPRDPKDTYKWYCCATSDCAFQTPLGAVGYSHVTAHKHLKDSHGIVGQKPGTAVAREKGDAARVVMESEKVQIWPL